jgi:hypothetical protein
MRSMRSGTALRRVLLITLLAGFGGSTAPWGSSAPQIPAATAPVEWTAMTGGESGAAINDGQKVALRNYTNPSGNAIYYHVRKYGINLDWRSWIEGRNVWFKRLATGGGSALYGERVAIGVDHGGYLRYAVRPTGINLKWSSSPVYEWEIRGDIGVSLGRPVRNSQTISLYNRTVGKYMVYGTRPKGINLVWWPKTPTTTTATVSHSARMGPFALPGDQPCTGDITWRFEPVSLTGSTGQNTTQNFTRSYSVTPTLMGDYYCIFSTLTGNLRLGTWRIQAHTPLWATNCDVTLRAGYQIVNFTSYRAGCRTGLDWP